MTFRAKLLRAILAIVMITTAASLLIVAHGNELLNEVRSLLAGEAVELRAAATADHALREIELERPLAVLTAAQLAGRSGLLLRRQITRRWAELERKVAIIHDKTPYGQGLADAVAREAAADGEQPAGEIVHELALVEAHTVSLAGGRSPLD